MRDVRIVLYCSIALHFARKIWTKCNRKPSNDDEFKRMYKLDLDKFKESIAKSAGIPVDCVFTTVSDSPILGHLDTSTIGLVRRTPDDLDKFLAFPDGNENREFKVPIDF